MNAQPKPSDETAQLERIRQLLKNNDDTTRFVGLALLKSTLETSASIRNDATLIQSLWNAISPKFLNRLLRSGARKSAGHTQSQQKRDEEAAKQEDILDIAANVIYTFAALLPEAVTSGEPSFIRHIERLVEALPHSSNGTQDIILKTLVSLVSSSEGGKVFAEIDEWRPVVEIAPKNQLALSVLQWSWLSASIWLQSQPSLREKVDRTLADLVVAYKGTDAVTLLDFISQTLPRLEKELATRRSPKWLDEVVDFISSLIAKRPNRQARQAYTNCAGALFSTFPEASLHAFFGCSSESSKTFSYLFINLILIDLRASLPTVLSKLNSPEYPELATRLSSALVVIEHFLGLLLKLVDDDDGGSEKASFSVSLPMPPDHLLKLQHSISDTMSLIIESLRDRWDAAVAGAQGLHPDARAGKAHTMTGSRLTITWDTADAAAATPSDDPLIKGCIRVLGIWIREDDGETLRRQAAGLMDMMVDLFQTYEHWYDRDPVLFVIEGAIRLGEGLETFRQQDGVMVLRRALSLLLSSVQGNWEGCEDRDEGEAAFTAHLGDVLSIVDS